MARNKINSSVRVETLKHKDKRANIPTKELRGFVAEDEKAPPTMLYPRDPSLDPQLVWKGKDEQDAKDLAVPVVPVYIQEKVQPQAIIEEVRAQARSDRPERQAALFSDFNGITFEDLVDFYHHEQNWSNRLILGDSLLVMTSLAEKEGLKGKVQMIYMDPPYGIKFGSNWQVSTRRRDVKDGKIEDFTSEPEQVKAFRDTWELGIHSYLAYLRERLVVARELLSETGSIFVQIGDDNVHLVRCLLDEIFGSENLIALITFKKTGGATGRYLPGTSDYLIWYAKNSDQAKFRPLHRSRKIGAEGAEAYVFVELDDRERRRMTVEEVEDQAKLPAGARVYQLHAVTSQRQGRPSGPGTAMYFPVAFRGANYYPRGSRGWTTTLEGMGRLLKADRIELQGDTLRYARFHADFPAFPITNLWEDTQSGSGMDKMYVVQTSTRVVERCLLMTTDPGDLVLDPTCGSGTTAYVAEQWGRRWITIDTSRVALALARTRIMAARYPYYLLTDSPEGILKEAEVTGQAPPNPLPRTERDVKRGFVYKRVPHVTLKSIANNEEIGAIHARWQEKLEPVRAKLNQALKKNWQEWEIPREADAKWPDSAKRLLDDWWRVRRERQKEIDDSIARHADTEPLYDQPYEDPKRVRVSGPFTVESLSPHRVISSSDGRPASENTGDQFDASGQFEVMVIDNLKKAGVQNTKKSERLMLDRLEPYAGEWLQAAGEYTDAKGKVRRVAVSIGPQYGTVSPERVREAAKEAVKGIGFDLLIVCGFAFDPHVSEEARRYGKLDVQTVRMNPDLHIGGVLKKTASANLFTIFGEPDIEIHRKNGKVTVTIQGVDIYDPTTREMRHSSTDDIACWFIDTDYNSESFFVRHAYFLGGGDPYDKLKRALRAEIDEGAWSALYSATSRPFDPPKTGKIAVKVINHYGDEVLKVLPVK